MPCCARDGVSSSSDLSFPQFFLQVQGNCPYASNYNWYYHHFHVLQLSLVLRQGFGIYYNYLIHLRVLPTSIIWCFFYWSLNFSKYPGLFSVFWVISTMLLFGWSPIILFISKSSSPFTNPLMTALSMPIITGITITFMLHSFFHSFTRSRNLSLFLQFFSFTQWSAGIAKSAIWQGSLFICWLSLGLLNWSRNLWISFFWADLLLLLLVLLLLVVVWVIAW